MPSLSPSVPDMDRAKVDRGVELETPRVLLDEVLRGLPHSLVRQQYVWVDRLLADRASEVGCLVDVRVVFVLFEALSLIAEVFLDVGALICLAAFKHHRIIHHITLQLAVQMIRHHQVTQTVLVVPSLFVGAVDARSRHFYLNNSLHLQEELVTVASLALRHLGNDLQLAQRALLLFQVVDGILDLFCRLSTVLDEFNLASKPELAQQLGLAVLALGLLFSKSEGCPEGLYTLG